MKSKTIVALSALLTLTGCQKSAVANFNLKNDANNFKIRRMEYLGRCACITTDNGFECPDDTNANWEFAIKELIKEKIGTDEVNHEQV